MNLTRIQAIELAEEIIDDASLYATPTELANAIADEKVPTAIGYILNNQNNLNSPKPG